MSRTDPFENILPFVLTAEAKSFATAAKRLGVNPSSVSRAVARLEAEVAVKLLRRTSRSVTLTSEGAAFFELCREVLEKMDQARSVLTAAQIRPTGVLRVSMPVGLGSVTIMPAIGDFMAKHPQLRLHATLSDRWVDLVQENFDLAVRIGPLPDSGLFARKIGVSQLLVVASPAYVEKHGRPSGPEQLSDHACLTFTNSSGVERPWRFRSGTTSAFREMNIVGYMTIDNGEAIVRAAEGGMGIAYVPDYMANKALRDGRLIELLPGQGEPAGEIFCVHPDSRHLSAKVRAFTEFVSALLKPSSAGGPR